MSEVEISGYRPGAIGRVTELHATYYHEHCGFDLRFEAEVAAELSEFLSRFRRAHLEGFDLSASLPVPAEDRARLEHLCRYLLRPPVAQDRLRLTSDGRISSWSSRASGPTAPATSSSSPLNCWKSLPP